MNAPLLMQDSRENAALVKAVAHGLELDKSGKLVFSAHVPAMWKSWKTKWYRYIV